jgi:hybrid cluster-associated redox disulfide protein
VTFDRPPDRGPVTKTTCLGDVLRTRPDAERVLFERFRLPCYDCEVAFFETVEQAAAYYSHDLQAMLDALNACPLGPEEEEQEPEESSQAG